MRLEHRASSICERVQEKDLTVTLIMIVVGNTDSSTKTSIFTSASKLVIMNQAEQIRRIRSEQRECSSSWIDLLEAK